VTAHDAAIRYACVAQFYAREAALLDTRALFDWVELFEDAAPYLVHGYKRAQLPTGRSGTSVAATLLYEDDKDFLRKRAERFLNTNLAHAERPPSVTRHLVSNVLIEEDRGDEVVAATAFAVFQTRLESDAVTFFGRREDLLVPTEDTFLIRSRRVWLDHSVLDRALTVLF
jgi:3-phenylpropionate/trans-cinnamate dioxygenase beta subunit